MKEPIIPPPLFVEQNKFNSRNRYNDSNDRKRDAHRPTTRYEYDKLANEKT